MSWLQSPPIKRLGYSTDVIIVVALLAGVVVALQAKGREWGAPLAVIVGGLAGWLIGIAVAFAIRRALSRPCPGCGGMGKTVGGLPQKEFAGEACSRCGGTGRIV